MKMAFPEGAERDFARTFHKRIKATTPNSFARILIKGFVPLQS